MKIPKIKIVWVPWVQRPHEYKVREIKNGYLIGDTYIATKEEVIKELSEYIKENL